MNARKKKKNILNFKNLMIKNKELIQDIVVSNAFMIELSEWQQHIEITFIDDEELGEQALLFGVPIKESRLITKNAILEMKDGETVIIII